MLRHFTTIARHLPAKSMAASALHAAATTPRRHTGRNRGAERYLARSIRGRA